MCCNHHGNRYIAKVRVPITISNEFSPDTGRSLKFHGIMCADIALIDDGVQFAS